MSLNILIVGVGVAGPALASLLVRSNPTHQITIIERADAIRLGGAQIDVKSQAVPVLRMMGLLDEVKAHTVQEIGLEMVDANDNTLLSLGVAAADKKAFTLTSEHEIMRGDLVKILYADSLDQRKRFETTNASGAGHLRYEFGKTITHLTQSEYNIAVTFSDGTVGTFDLVVAADGQRSRTRRLAFGPRFGEEAFKSLRIHAAYYSIPRILTEGGMARAYVARNKFLATRTSERSVTQALVFTTQDHARLVASYREPIEAQKKLWTEIISGAGWQHKRFVEGLASCDDFYAHEQGQVKVPSLFKGRVVLLGDAGYCPAPFTGLGTTLALGGAYVLAGELAKHGRDVVGALREYEAKIRPLVDECQQLPLTVMSFIFPTTDMGVWLAKTAMRVISMFGVDKIMNWWVARDASVGGGQSWKMPEYPQLNLSFA